MAVKIKFDPSGNAETPTLVLSNRNGDKLGNLTNITNVVFRDNMTNASELTFTAHKFMSGNELKIWDDLKDFKLIWVPEWDYWFEISVEIDDEDETIKSVIAKSLGESELSQINLYNIEINTEIDISRDDYVEPTIFYNADNKPASLLHRILEKAPHYEIKHVDTTLTSIQRTFTFDNESIYDAFQDIASEIQCLFVIECHNNTNGSISREIYVYDMETNCLDCGHRDLLFLDECPVCGSENIISGFGNDTTIFINKDNFADEINYSTDVDSVKNCFKLESGDDLMDAAIRSCNPNGTDYLYFFSEETKNDMSESLRSKINSYDNLYNYYQNTHSVTLPSSVVSGYNSLINKYSSYTTSEEFSTIPTTIVGFPNLMNVYFDTIDFELYLEAVMMPEFERDEYTAENQAEYLLDNLDVVSTTSITNLSLSTANNIILTYANAIVYSAYKTTITSSSLSGTTWTGKFTITNYSDEEDTYTTANVSVVINDNYENYIKQRLKKILFKEDSNVYGIVGLFDLELTLFQSELKKYCLDSLNIFQKCCQSCIDIMIQHNESNSDSAIYNDLYIPYYNKLMAIQDEILVRENEIYSITGKYNNEGHLVTSGLQTYIEEERNDIQIALDFEQYLGQDLWKEFSSFKREDKYSNSNYISDGLNNKELFQNAKDFITVANKELYKSATLQHSISSSLKNLLIMKEFKPLLSYFEIGNWIRVSIDDEIYKLRMIEYEIDFDDYENISVVFSDVEKTVNGYSDIKDILDRANSMSTSYSGLIRQSEINSNVSKSYTNMVKNGLSMTMTKIVSNADNQEVMWDEHGLLCREYDDITDDYNPHQLKLINHGMYLTDDNWKTARAAVGRFMYFDPKDGTYKEGYGVIADTIVSNIVLSEEVGIYNAEGSIELGKDGIIVTTNTYNKNVFTIQREYTDDEGNVLLDKQLYIDDDGNIVLGGNSKISWDNVTGGKDYVDSVVGENINNFAQEITEDISNLQSQIDGNITTYFEDYSPTTTNYPASEWITDELKNQHLGDLFYIVNNDDDNGLCYRYALVNGEYKWILIEDAELAKALANAAKAQDTADGKRRVFVNTPTPPYDVGDLWTQGENGDLLRCQTAKSEGQSYSEDDWIPATKYTDDSALQEFINGVFETTVNYLTQQADQKAETWYQSTDPSLSWDADEKLSHKGDIWYDTTNEVTYIYNGYEWENTKTTPPQEVFDLIDGKAQIFMSQPIPPYNVGDLWFNSSNSEIMTCTSSRSTGSFNSADWEKKNKYTDDSSLTNFINTTYTESINYLTQQIDGKVETWRQSTDPSLSWSNEEKLSHTGDIWLNTNTDRASIFNGTTWDEISAETVIPDELFDKIDGKAKIFTTTPTPPYNIGDLWVQGSTGDILKCVNVKTDGESYSASDWERASKYTDDTTANEALGQISDLSTDYNKLKQILGYDGTIITGTYIYSPNIIGGQISIGSAASGVQAQITSDGKFTATGVDISGVIKADSGEIGGFTIASNSLYSGSNVFGGSGVYVSPNGISCGSAFKVTSSGNLTATNVDISGIIKATQGNIGGFTIGTSALYNGSPILGNSGVYLGTNGISCGSDFVVNSNGNMSAKTGSIAGFTFTDTLDNNTHAYQNTLYRIVNGSDGYDYQAGIKAASATNGETEAAFYIRRKLPSQNWSQSTLPFYVRNNGYVYAEDLTVGQSFYMMGSTLTSTSDEYNYTSQRFKVLSCGADEVSVGMLNSGWRTTYGRSGYDCSITYDNGSIYHPYTFTYEGVYNGYPVFSLYPSSTGIKVNLGSTFGYFQHLYINEINFADGSKMSTAGVSGGTSNYNDLSNKPQINSVSLSGNKTYSDLGLAASDHTHSLSSLGAASSSHNHSGTQLGSASSGVTSIYTRNLYVNDSIELGGISRSSWPSEGTTNYNNLINKPQINGVTLSGNESSSTLGLAASNHNHSGTTLGSSSSGVTAIYARSGYFKDTLQLNSSPVLTSDKNLKCNISSYDNKIEQAYMEFQPISFMYKNCDEQVVHDRTHYGFSAQQIEEVLIKNNINNIEAGFLCINNLDTPNEVGEIVQYGLRYDEFISINTHMTQKAHKRINSQEREIEALKSEILLLQGELAILKQKMEVNNYA